MSFSGEFVFVYSGGELPSCLSYIQFVAVLALDPVYDIVLSHWIFPFGLDSVLRRVFAGL